MKGLIRKNIALLSLLLLLGVFFTQKANAATLSQISDTISTSRPSNSAPLAADQAAGATQATLVDLPNTISNTTDWLASDSAVFNFDTGQTLNTINVASMSAANTPAANQQIMYLTSSITNAHHKGTAVFTSMTAEHTIKFTTSSNLPASGHIIITFPGAGNNTASPSATTFAFNNIASGQITTSANISCTWTITAPSLDCLLAGTLAGSSTVTINLGCTAGTSSCTTFSPRLINPVKGSTAAGTADTWKVTVQTTDTTGNGGTVIDVGSAKIATVEAVQVQASVEPTLTFTISGRTDGTNITAISGSCGSIVLNTGIDSTATFVNLGVLSNGAVNFAAQQLQVSTNGSSGYAITATSSGRFINPASGFFLPDANTGSANGLTANDTPVPAVITGGVPAFGVHACGVRSNVNSDQWVNAGTSATARFSNPWNTGTSGFYATIASYTGGPVTNENTAALYGATVSGTTPAGIYSNYFTYVATATF